MGHLVLWWVAFTAYTKSNPVVAGIVSLWGVSMVTLVFRKIPARIYAWIYGQITTTLELDNSGMGFSQENYTMFMNWLVEQKYARFTRHYSLITYGSAIDDLLKEGKTAKLGAGSGQHWFFFKRRYFKASRRMLERQGNENTMFVISVTMFGRDRRILQALVDEFSFKLDQSKIQIYRWRIHDQTWSSQTHALRRDMASVIIDKAIKDKLIGDIKAFYAEKEWYKERGLPWKKTFIFSGPPGTGKTSLVRALATYFNMSIAVLDLNAVSDVGLSIALSYLPSNTLLLIEDFDSCPATLIRDGMRYQSTRAAVDEARANTNPYGTKEITLSGILNAFDGVVGMDGLITILTTNVIEEIDPAILRKGRTDHIFEIGKLHHKEVVEYIELMFPNIYLDSTIRFDDILGCDLQALYFDHHKEANDFVNAIPGSHSERVAFLKHIATEYEVEVEEDENERIAA
jgi:chaperone BCS1